ncbi:hypothetical protein [Paenibacillus validus]|uniref:hypothetical protein n=1 Tax=Paenibacillus validus TaxID=44253 RepID=UPI0006D00EF6
MHAEPDRLLYVAATRAKQMLVVSLYPDQPAKCPWSSLMDGMELIRELDFPESDVRTDEFDRDDDRDNVTATAFGTNPNVVFFASVGFVIHITEQPSVMSYSKTRRGTHSWRNSFRGVPSNLRMMGKTVFRVYANKWQKLTPGHKQ